MAFRDDGHKDRDDARTIIIKRRNKVNFGGGSAGLYRNNSVVSVLVDVVPAPRVHMEIILYVCKSFNGCWTQDILPDSRVS